ncbi:MAG: NUDIX domain-containing protein [Acidiferrobacteraceae bacterium]
MLPSTPLLTVDVIIELEDRPGRPIVLIERAHEPFGWALPGGFVDRGEPIERAAVREALEETGLRVQLAALLYCYSDPARDSRLHTVSAVFVASARGEPRADDDAKNVAIIDPADPARHLAFDHGHILADYLVFRQSGRRPSPRV